MIHGKETPQLVPALRGSGWDPATGAISTGAGDTAATGLRVQPVVSLV